jgi:N-acetylmuramoyl-L-alanine amidase
MPAVRPVRRRAAAPARSSAAVSRHRAAAFLAATAALALSAGASVTVQPGDTLSGLAARHGVSARELAAANNLADPNRIVAGQTLALPGGGPAAGGIVHTVAAGETLGRIAARYGVTQAAVAEANNLTNRNLVVAGQRLQIPRAATPGAATPGAAAPGTAAPGGGVATTVSHTVGQGENLAGIAARYGVPVRAIVEANSLANPNLVRVGQTLQIPGATAAPGGGQTGGAAPAAGPSRAEVGALLERTARQYGWNPAFVKAVAWQESGWNQGVVSRANAIGIMQVLPSTGQFVSQYVVRRPLDITRPEDNVEAGVAFLDYLYRLTGGDTEMILAGYYQGLASVRRNGMYPTTERYIANVLALRERFR